MIAVGRCPNGAYADEGVVFSCSLGRGHVGPCEFEQKTTLELLADEIADAADAEFTAHAWLWLQGRAA